MTRLRALTLAVAVCCIAAPSRVAHAAPSAAQSAEAAKLKKQADDLFDQHRYADALALYVKAFQVSGDPALVYNQGRALEAIGDYPEALAKLEEFVSTAPPELLEKVPGIERQMDDLKKRIAIVVVRSSVRGARVLIRDKNVGEVNGALRVLTRAGKATIEVVADGHEPFRAELDLRPGRETAVDATPEVRKNTATLSVRSAPVSASVVVDGVAVGRAPLKTMIDPGPHRVKVSASGYEDESVDISVRAGEHRNVAVDLHKSSSVFGAWWFWTGLAVVAGATAATVIVVTREPETSAGTFNPGRVEAPLVSF
ncbi:MAG: PEGA domain-containing protein [Myxococcales bacterium]|nr:PEGA domain-containing protein [Myxococcales bacterium]